MFTWLAAKLGATVAKYVVGGVLIAFLVGGSFLTYKITGWFHASRITALEKERDKALKDWKDEKQRAEDLEKKVKFQQSQKARRQKVQKEVSDVDQAVTNNDLDFFRRNEQRLYDYKNPAGVTPQPGRIRKRFDPAAKERIIQ